LAYLEQESGGSGVELARGLLRRKWIILFCLAAGCGLGYLQFLQQPPIYQTSARILIIKEDAGDIPVQAMVRQVRAYEENIATQVMLLRSPLIVEEAVKKKGLTSLSVFTNAGDPVGMILGGLEVKRADERASVLDLNFSCGSAEDCQTILQAIMESYEDFLLETHTTVSRDTVKLITEAKETLLEKLEHKEKAYREFREATPLLWTKEGTFNIHQARLNQIEATRASLLISRSQTKAQLQALEAAIERGGSREAIMLMMDKSSPVEFNGGTGKAGVASTLFPLLLEEQMLLEDYGVDHPNVKRIRKRIQVTRNHLRSSGLDDAEPFDENQKKAGPTDFVAVYLDSLREDIRSIDEKQKELDDLFVIEAEEAKKLSDYEVSDETMRQDILRTRQLFEGVVKRLEEINLIQDYGKMKTRVMENAKLGYQIAPVMSRIMGFAGTMGFFAGCALAFLLEMADKRFRSPEEITEKLGVPVIGHIPYYKPETSDEASPIDGSICVYHRPKSNLAEAYRGIRTALYFSTRGEGHKVIQVSSPNPGDGKSTMATNLSVAIAQSGKRTLLVESDFRRPRVHKLLGIDREVGVTSVISGESELSAAIQETGVENLFALTCGPKPSNPSELLSSPRYAELVDLLREKFDYVIIDTPPLMAVTDPAVVATRVDGILMTIRISKRSQQDCLQSAELLASLGANQLGVIVNGVDNSDRYGGYGYGGYRQTGGGKSYGYNGYGSGYFSYGYDARYSSYYGEDDDLPTPLPPARRKKRPRPPLETT
jgi:capsular exopolysaccharide synthesis family protein